MNKPNPHRNRESQPPLALDYERRELDPVRRRRIRISGILLVVGWAPYLCGVLNALVVRRYPFSQDVVDSHSTSSLIFMAGGIALSAIALFSLIRMRYVTGTLLAASALVAQISIALCLSLS